MNREKLENLVTGIASAVYKKVTDAVKDLDSEQERMETMCGIFCATGTGLIRYGSMLFVEGKDKKEFLQYAIDQLNLQKEKL